MVYNYLIPLIDEITRYITTMNKRVYHVSLDGLINNVTILGGSDH